MGKGTKHPENQRKIIRSAHNCGGVGWDGKRGKEVQVTGGVGARTIRFPAASFLTCHRRYTREAKKAADTKEDGKKQRGDKQGYYSVKQGKQSQKGDE